MAGPPHPNSPVWPRPDGFSLAVWREGLEATLLEMVREDGPGEWGERLRRIISEEKKG